jgi:hypothetical protein
MKQAGVDRDPGHPAPDDRADPEHPKTYIQAVHFESEGEDPGCAGADGQPGLGDGLTPLWRCVDGCDPETA